MNTSTTDPDGTDAFAAKLVAAIDGGGHVPPLTDSEIIDIPAAYRVAAAMRRRREAAGARHVGRKIGFSNRTIWPVYGIDAPMWGDMYDRTVRSVSQGDKVELGRLPEPRIEPEIAFGLAAPPSSDMTDAQVLACCAWVAHGFEIVQSPYRDWKFRGPDTIAAGGLHGLLLLGERRPAGPEWLEPLGNFRCTLSRDGAVAAEGHSANVLDGPLRALRHLAAVLEANPESPRLAPGEIVTTGTLTDAFPVAPGQRWTSKLEGLDLPALDIRFA